MGQGEKARVAQGEPFGGGLGGEAQDGGGAGVALAKGAALPQPENRGQLQTEYQGEGKSPSSARPGLWLRGSGRHRVSFRVVSAEGARGLFPLRQGPWIRDIPWGWVTFT